MRPQMTSSNGFSLILNQPIINTVTTLCHRLHINFNPRTLARRIKRTLCVAALATASFAAYALPADFFATTSQLASGNWAKVEVTQSGMQFISNSTLRNLGFSDPSKVNVYGFGGRMLPEYLNNTMTDDLPLIPCVHTASGIVFFGHSTEKWAVSGTTTKSYTHTPHAYSDNSYYFISDKDNPAAEIGKAAEVTAGAGNPLTTFTERMVYEKDLITPATSGRTYLGEDFRTQSTRTFSFNLPGNTGNASVRIRFGAKVTSGSSTLTMSANGSQLASSTSDKIAGVSSSDTYLAMTTTTKTVADAGEKLNLAIQYSYTGTLFTAALDYIEVTYPRTLQLSGGELYFYLSPNTASAVTLAGCSQNTVLWDITDPTKPMAVDATLNGNQLSFNTPSGYREYVAFNAAEIKRQPSPAGKVQNQDIHGDEMPDMVIISPEPLLNTAKRIADLHNRIDGMNVAIYTPQQIYNEFSSGTPDVTAFRKMLKMWYTRAGEKEDGYTKYCLILSRPTYDNKALTAAIKKADFPRIPIWQSPSGFTPTSSYSTDDYIGMLADSNSAPEMTTAKINVAVGRMPVTTVADAITAVDKLEKYMTDTSSQPWHNNVMVIADDQDNGTHLTQAEKVIEAMRATGSGDNYVYEKLYLDSYPQTLSASGTSYELATQRLLDKFSEGVLLINYIGHANAREWGHEHLFTWTHANSMTNTNLPFLYASTCEYLEWDADNLSAGEVLWRYPESGVIGMISPSRPVYIAANGTLNQNTSKYFFMTGKDGKLLTVGEVMIRGKNETHGDNLLRYGLMGDPAMRLSAPTYRATVDRIGNDDLASIEDAPVLQARSKTSIKGRVTDDTGATLTDYNGQAYISVYDAEKVVTTYGHGKEGKVSDYNDRKTLLFKGMTDIVAGEWEAEIMIPSEIENNFSPALISVYANDNQGREANGKTEDFYIYGFNENADEDNNGPEIKSIYINSKAFTDGGFVSPNSTLYAEFTDPSGINLSDAGIGHSMLILVDGKLRFDDVSLYYSPSKDVETGSVAYPLSSLGPGQHTLDFTVWDNANNSTTATVNFMIKADWLPSITELYTDANPASTSATFTVVTDGNSGNMNCRIDVFDLNGRKVWTDEQTSLSTLSNATRMTWNLCDRGGRRVNRGIYIYRATVTTAEGAEISKSGKLAVTAQ